MKKRILIAFVFSVMLIAALSVSAGAKFWDDNPFTDVKSDAWYYDAVRICNENELFNGTTNTTFTPGMKMSRAMLAQVLANADGYDKSEYTGSSFKDVKPTAWYASAVEWASRNGVTSGTGNGKFSPDALISREQLATMLRRYAEYKGMDVTVADASFDAFADADKVSDWATEGLLWAVEKGVVKGADVKGTLYLNPKNNAARNECAQMLSNFLYIEPRYEINGNDISLYTIVYNEAEEGSEGPTLESAEYLQTAIKLTLGIELPIAPDTEFSEYEILVGRTQREADGLVTVDRDSFKDDQVYIWSVQGNRLVIAGIDTEYSDYTDRSGRNVAGTRNAVFNFCEKVLGLYEYIDDFELPVCETDPVISLNDGYYYEDMTWYRMRTFYMKGNVNSTGDYTDSLSHNMSTWISGEYSREDEVHHDATPCMSSEENIKAVITHVREELENNPTVSVLGIGINDSNPYCKCDTCMALYREYKSRSATLALMTNRVCEDIEEDYPDVVMKLGAYTYCQQPPQGIMMHDNVMIEFFTVANCSGHAYSDTSCSVNKDLAENLYGWDDIANGEIVIWDHTGGFIYFLTPQPDWDSLLENVRFFADRNAREMLMNSVFYGEDLPNGESPKVHSDFGNVRAYMLSMIYMDPYMSEEEYYYRLDGCLEGNFGEGWKYMREYIDIISELGNAKDHSFHAPPSGHFDFEAVCERADYIDSLWVKAKELATPEQLERIEICEASWIFLRQCATFEDRYENGTEESRAEYVAQNQYLLDFILEKRLIWTEGTLNPLENLDMTVAPNRW